MITYRVLTKQHGKYVLFKECSSKIEAGKLMDQLNNYYLQLAQKQAGNSELSELAYINAFNRVIIQY